KALKHVADAEALVDLWIAIDRGALPQPHAEKGGRREVFRDLGHGRQALRPEITCPWSPDLGAHAACPALPRQRRGKEIWALKFNRRAEAKYRRVRDAPH